MVPKLAVGQSLQQEQEDDSCPLHKMVQLVVAAACQQSVNAFCGLEFKPARENWGENQASNKSHTLMFSGFVDDPPSA